MANNLSTDRSNNQFIEVGNLRITFIPSSNRDPTKDWAGSHVIRFQAYKDPSKSKKLYRGAEYPVNTHSDVYALITGIISLIEQNMT